MLVIKLPVLHMRSSVLRILDIRLLMVSFQKKSVLQKQRKLYNFPPLGNDESDHIMQLQHDLLWNRLALGGAAIEIGKRSGDITSK